jgi:invasion protein IalB
LVAALGLGAQDILGQQAQEEPTEQPAPPQQETPQQQEAPQGQSAPAEQTISERQFQDWMVRCGRRDEQGAEFCEMHQQRIDSEERTIMLVAVGQVPGTSDLGLLIILPLGILLPAGVTLQVDDGAEVPLQVDRCERQGCRIEMLLEPELMNRLKSGREAKVFFEAHDPQGERQRLGVPISLLGFTAALNEIAA